MDFTLPYGTHTLHGTLDWATVLATLRTADAPALADPEETLRSALRNPLHTPPLPARLRQGETVLIIVSDSFRKTGIHYVLPTLIAALNDQSIEDNAISFLFATGSHRPPTPEEQREILGPSTHDRFKERAFSHDPHDATQHGFCGTTSRGTPVYINRRALDADHVIATGTVVLHYFGGFGGGRKSIVPGIAGTKTIAANHALNLHPTAPRLNPAVAIGRLEGNPVAEDMLEGARLGPSVFLINTVLNRDGAIAHLVAGELEAAHRAACEAASALFHVPFEETADFVIASAGTAKNFVQSHKALYNAFQVLKPGGFLLLAAPAPEGFGGNKFSEWLSLGSTAAIITALRQHAEINGQTALSTLEKARGARLITELSIENVNALGAIKVPDLPTGLAQIRAKLSERGIDHPTCYIMPDAACSVPFRATP